MKEGAVWEDSKFFFAIFLSTERLNADAYIYLVDS